MPDIVVTLKGSYFPLLIVEAKLDGDLEASVAAFKSLMKHRGCLTGLLFVGRTVYRLRDHLSDDSSDSIGMVSAETTGVDELQPRAGSGAEEQFVAQVHRWLLSLADDEAISRLPVNLQVLIADHVASAIEYGDVRLTGLRYPLVAAE